MLRVGEYTYVHEICEIAARACTDPALALQESMFGSAQSPVCTACLYVCCTHCKLLQHECHGCDRVGGCDAGAMQQGAQHFPVPRPLLCAIHRPAISATGTCLLSTTCCSCLPLAAHAYCSLLSKASKLMAEDC